MPYRLIIFDFDCTLADSGDRVIGFINSLAEKHGFRRSTPAEVEAMRSMGNREIMKRMGVRPWRLPGIARDLRRLSEEAAATTALFAGASDLLAALEARGIEIAIVSSNSEVAVRRVLGPENEGRIGYYGCGASLFGKAPVFRALLRRARIRPAEVLCVGDETRDIEAARKAGLAAAAVTWGIATADALTAMAPDFVVGSFDELQGIVIT